MNHPLPQSVLAWLLSGDPAIRWQVQRDLLAAPAQAVAHERRNVAREGWGARLLARQGPDGRWAAGKSSHSGLYVPKWISTTYTMLLLRDLGVLPTHRRLQKACALLLDNGLQGDGGLDYGPWASGRGETCISGMGLSILASFEYDDRRLDTLVDYLLEQQMPDGGWNCQRRYGATHASVHTTILALEGLHHYELFRQRKRRTVRTAQARGREFLLMHRLFRSDRTGAVINPVFLQLSFPPRWHYDILRALDYFQAVGAPRDERLSEAIDIVRGAKDATGRWPLQKCFKGKVYFQLERVGFPSRWNTLRALRVLKWWDRTGTSRLKTATPAP